MDTLARRYDAFAEALRQGDFAGAHRHFQAIAGLDAEPEDQPPRTSSRALAAPLIRYEVPRAIDLVALRARARDVAKFEDLSLATARALVEKLGSWGLKTVTVGPYARRMDVTLSVATHERAAVPADRYAVIASRADEARHVADAERDRSPAGTRRAGLALGYPRCCVERFVEVERSPEAARDGVNEASLRAFVDASTVAWELNPLSDLSLVGFMPCRGECPEALSFARRVLAALKRHDPAAHARTRTVLTRPVLFVRYTMFWALDGVAGDDAVRYARAVAHDDGAHPELSRWRGAYFGEALAEGDTVVVDRERWVITRGGVAVASWRLGAPPVPRLVAFSG